MTHSPLSRTLVVLALWMACATASEPPEAARPFTEAPMLRKLVEAGELPPVEERLPQNPAVVEPVHSIGTYGGVWRRLAIRSADSLLGSRLGYEPLVRWDRTGRGIMPGLAKSWEVRDDGRTYEFHLRRGVRWSDGEPFTSADILFWFEDIISNKEVTPVFPTAFGPGSGPFEVTAPDPWTAVFTFERPNGVFLEVLAFRSMVYAPAHYLRQFHGDYADEASLRREMRAAGLNNWMQLFQDRRSMNNPDCPSLNSWIIKVPPPTTRMYAERNPYYWKVDPEGQQLPYIDGVSFTMVQNPEVANLKIMAGEVDMTSRFVDPSKFTLFMQNRHRSNYRVLVSPSESTQCVFVNLHSKDAVLRPILKDRRFRFALSMAIDRDELIELVYSGLAQKSTGVGNEADPYWLPEFDEKEYLDHNPQKANRLLDEVGLRRGPGGLRRLPNGEPFRVVLHCYPVEGGAGQDLWQLVVDYWREVGLDFVLRLDARNLSVMQVANANTDFWAYSQPGIHWTVEPRWYIPTSSWSYFAPLYGRYINHEGRSGVKPAPEFQRIVDWYEELTSIHDDEERKLELGRSILGQWAEECYIIPVVREVVLTIVGNNFKNVPDRYIHSWLLKTPGYINPEQFYMEE